MSSEAPPGGFSPAGKPGKLTVDEFRAISGIIKDLLASEPGIKYSIYAAGIAGILEAVHLLWLFARFIYYYR